MTKDAFTSPRVARAFARAEKLLGAIPFTLDDTRALKGVVNRIHQGETILPNNTRIKADAMIVATRPQFTPANGVEKLPAPLSGLTFEGTTWRAQYVASDETHVTLYCAKTS